MSETPAGIHLNGRAMTWPEGCEALRPMVERSAVVAGGGVLLRAAIAGDMLAIRAEPNFRDGQRVHHYDMTLPDGAEAVLSAMLNPSPQLAVLMNPNDLPTHRDVLRRTCIAVGRALLAAGLTGRCPLAPVSRQALEEALLFIQAPCTLREMAEGPVRRP